MPTARTRNGVAGASCALAVVVAALVLSNAPVARAEGVHKSLSCTFDGGVSTLYERGEFKSKPPQVLIFDITDIDLEGQSARLTTGSGSGAGALRVIRALNANHFLEVVNEGFLNLTTVYDIDPATAAYPAVHSRHLGVLGQPVFAQYTGTCKPVP